ncbi:putative bacteriophage protein [Shigella sonnei]|nr:putative bacteriophage protein [Shigella sonnei]
MARMFDTLGFYIMNVQHFDFFTDNEFSNLERYQTCKAMAKGYAGNYKTGQSRLMHARSYCFSIVAAYWDTRVDEKERQVRCKICGAVVEPFDWMLSVAKRETRLADDVRLLRQEEQERRRNIEKLIQIERNAKARIRRATKSRTE